ESELELSYGLNNLGNILIKLGDFEMAESTLNEAMEIKRRLKVMPSLANTLNILGELYVEVGQPQRALVPLKEALAIGHEVKDMDVVHSANSHLGQAYLKLGNLRASETSMLSALKSVDQNSASVEDVLLLESLSTLYKKRKNPRKALQYIEMARKLDDSLQNLDRLESINRLKTQYEVKEKELEISRLKSNQLLQDAEIEKKERERIFFIGTILLGTAVILFLYRAYVSRKRKNAQLLLARQELESKNSQLSKSEEQLTKSNQDKEVLLKEVHHRVKNNLQIVNSLLSIQARQSNKIGDINEFLHNSQNRLQSIALIHETLYASQSLAKVDVGDYLNKLSDYIISVGTLDSEEITVLKSFDTLGLDIQRVVPLGLIFSELITNAIKHAFPNNQGELKLSFGKTTKSFVLKVMDNGTGFKENNEKSLGLQLVELLTDQLLGTIHYKNTKGTEAVLEFPLVDSSR
ncbi:MAG: histidine kinase dimerization/phosphoacceptor domain -containing protein, partial [Bacteroidota bacterium]